MMSWTHSGPAILAAFLASLVEFVEALTIVLAVGITRGWRSALIGAAVGVVFLAVLVGLFGPALSAIPIHILQFAIGVLLLLFGMRWLRKAILRSAGVLGLHDEESIFVRQTQSLGGAHAKLRDAGVDALGFVTSFKAVVIEGLEVVFIVMAVGSAGHMLLPASLGAAAAGLVVLGFGVALHRPLAQVPENALKFAVGVILSAFGVFWIGEGLDLPWPGEDWAIVALATGFTAVALVAVRSVRAAQS